MALIRKEINVGDNPRCSICREETENQHVAIQLRCSHDDPWIVFVFCSTCIAEVDPSDSDAWTFPAINEEMIEALWSRYMKIECDRLAANRVEQRENQSGTEQLQ